MEALGLLPNLDGVGLATIVIFVIFCLVVGWLLPKRVSDKLLKAKDEIIEMQAEQIKAYEPIQPTMVKVLDALNRDKPGESRD